MRYADHDHVHIYVTKLTMSTSWDSLSMDRALNKMRSALQITWKYTTSNWILNEGRSRKCLECDGVIKRINGVPLQMIFCSFDCFMKSKRRQTKGTYWMCSMPGCERSCAQNDYGQYYDYCRRGHARAHTEELRQMYQQSFSHHSAPYTWWSSTGPILFYSKGEPYYEFTNFAYYPIIIDGFLYSTSEHYFQSQKLVGTPYERYVAVLPRPRDAFEFPRQPHVSQWIRKDWQEVKEDIMFKALYHKFTEYPQLKKLLLDTGGRELKEDSPHDSYWGIGRDRRGQNRLGVLLMKLRETLRNWDNLGGRRISTDDGGGGSMASHTPHDQFPPSNDSHSHLSDKTTDTDDSANSNGQSDPSNNANNADLISQYDNIGSTEGCHQESVASTTNASSNKPSSTGEEKSNPQYQGHSTSNTGTDLITPNESASPKLNTGEPAPTGMKQNDPIKKSLDDDWSIVDSESEKPSSNDDASPPPPLDTNGIPSDPHEKPSDESDPQKPSEENDLNILSPVDATVIPSDPHKKPLDENNSSTPPVDANVIPSDPQKPSNENNSNILPPVDVNVRPIDLQDDKQSIDAIAYPKCIDTAADQANSRNQNSSDSDADEPMDTGQSSDDLMEH